MREVAPWRESDAQVSYQKFKPRCLGA
ncbi:uncharacterized protein G2W53_040888 [Senna tora]|uniref:Uncharacterized protein n=1 Tax=Senna tora TaxID=362788 RepID=A0A834SEB0_9FABA|nr:uncharacterized protein G2W53_040888 [Senna tora]